MPIDQAPARCYPSKPDHGCYSCARHRFGDPAPVSARKWPVIDASIARFQGECGMFVLRMVPVRSVVERGSALERAWRAAA